MKKLLFCLSLFTLISCEKYVTEISDLTLSGRYVVSRIDVVNSNGNNQTFEGAQVYSGDYPHPFNNIPVNNFYMLFEGSGFIGFFQLGRLQPFNLNQWLYGNNKNLFFRVYGNNSYNHGYLALEYKPIGSTSNKIITFLIEEDGFEHLKLLSSGIYKNGIKTQIRLYLQREHP